MISTCQHFSVIFRSRFCKPRSECTMQFMFFCFFFARSSLSHHDDASQFVCANWCLPRRCGALRRRATSSGDGSDACQHVAQSTVQRGIRAQRNCDELMSGRYKYITEFVFELVHANVNFSQHLKVERMIFCFVLLKK